MSFYDIILNGLIYGFISGFIAFFFGYAIKKSLDIFNL